MRAKQKWLLSTLLVSSLGAQIVPHSALAEPKPAKTPDEKQLQNDQAATSFTEALAEVVSEDTAQRTLYSKEYLLSDNSRETVLSAAPLHYQDANGDYQDIRLSLMPQAASPEKETPNPSDIPSAEEPSASEPESIESQQSTDGSSEAPEAPLTESESDKASMSSLSTFVSPESIASNEEVAEAPSEPDPSEDQPTAQTPEAQPPAEAVPDAQQPVEETPTPDVSDPEAPIEEEIPADEEKTPAAPSAEPDYTSSTVPYTPSLHNDYAQGFSLSADSNSLTLVPVNAQDAQADVSEAAAGKLNYANVWNSTDASLALTASGIEQTLSLVSAAAPSTFSFEVEGQLGADLNSGSLSVSSAWLTDANGQRREVQQTLREEGGVRYLDVNVDHDDLAYPIALHTGIVLQTTAQMATVTAQNSDAPAEMSLLSRSAPKQPERRTYLQFDLSGLPEDAAVREAYLTSAASGEAGNPNTLRVLRAVEPWNEATLTSEEEPRTALRADGASYGKLRTDESGQQRIDLDPDLITRWLTDEQPNYGVQIDSAGEPTSFAEAPQLHIRHGGDTVSTLSAAGTPMQFQYFYDAQSRLQYILFSSGERINFTYDTNGNLIKREYVQGS